MTFTNIQIYNLSNKLTNEQIEDRVIKFKESFGYILTKENNDEMKLCNDYIKILFSDNSKFVTIFDSSYEFKSLIENKSYIRKLSKFLNLPVFSITCLENKHVVIEQYNFNKRIYDYLSVGNMYEKVKELGFISLDTFNCEDVWREYFVGKNDISMVYKIIRESKNYFEKSFVIEEIFKLYGVSSKMSLFNKSIKNSKTLYFDNK